MLLVAEDDDDLRETMSNMLGEAGYAVHAVRHGGEAVHALEAGGVRPRAIVLDLVMPVMNGWNFWDWLQGSPFAGVPIIIFTATGLSQGAFGAVRVVQKGRNPRDLLDALSSALGPIAKAG
ncbi:MAG: response regulator [Deltaproteobacteria bacterium]|nr:response regulator [Deltaproteobacteria bacterium]